MAREDEESKLSSLFGSPGYGAGESVENEGAHSYQTYCLDVATGEVVWQQTAHHGQPQVKRHPKSTHANSTIGDEYPYCINGWLRDSWCFHLSCLLPSHSYLAHHVLDCYLSRSESAAF